MNKLSSVIFTVLLLASWANLTAIASDANLRATEQLVVVQDGKPVAVRYASVAWEQATDGLQSPSDGRGLFAGKDLGPGDFQISARLKLDRLDGTAASFMMNNSHLGFDGRGKALFIEGPLFSGQKLLPEAAKPLIKSGQAFDLKVVRENGVTRFLINQREILRMDNWKGAAEQIGFRPHRNRITLERFAVQGNLVAPTQPLGIPVFISGQAGYSGYRIPALAVTAKGTLLAICEGRRNSRSDTGDIDLLVRRSTDHGKTWSLQQVVWDDGGNTCGNPCVVVDRDTGRIWLLTTWNCGDDHEGSIIAGTSKDTRRVFVTNSNDDGVTWAKPVEITADVKQKDWTWYATGPGSGIQIEHGPHRGRLVIPCDHIEKDSKHYYSHVIYSDDHGKSWKLGGSTPEHKVNECEVVELADGRLMLNCRNYSAQRYRQIVFSDDGGLTWNNQRHDETLIEPICQAAIELYRWPSQGKPGVMLFSNPASTAGRRHMTVRASFDNGKTWPVARVLNPGPSAYSDLAVLPDGQIACLYEGGTDYDVQHMMFANFSLDSLQEATRP